MTARHFSARCSCGRVVLELDGAPMVYLSCYCDDCQAAAALVESLPGGKSGKQPDGGTPSVLFRKDLMRCTAGAELLKAYRVRPESFTERLVASCCNTAMTQVHHNWWPHRGVKANLFSDPLPPMQMRIFTKYAPDPSAIPDDVPAFRTVPPRFALQLLRAAASLRLSGRHRSGEISYSGGEGVA